MPIRWNALQVWKSLEEIEELVSKADVFLNEAKGKAREATRIPNLPSYIFGPLTFLIHNLETTKTHVAISRIQQRIPKDALEKEEQRAAQLTLE